MTMRLRAIGFWADEQSWHWPRPELLVQPPRSPDERTLIGRYLRRGTVTTSYRGASWCRFHCDERDMGFRELSDGRWLWPEGLPHYVEQHNVVLPEEFVEEARARGFDCPAWKRPRVDFLSLGDEGVDLEFWLTWTQGMGAAVDMTAPWQLVSQEQHASREVRELGRELMRELPADHPLAAFAYCPRAPVDFLRPASVLRLPGGGPPAVAEMELIGRRLDCDDILLRIEDSWHLAVVHLTWSGHEEARGFPVTTIFDSWAEWNRWRRGQALTE